MHLDHLHENASPVSVSQPGLIRLSSPARAIALDVLRVNSLQTGAYVSRFRGRGMEFDESRPYQPGDDPRSIDWKVWSRTDKYYVKEFEEETNLKACLVLDGSASTERPVALISPRCVVPLRGCPTTNTGGCSIRD